MGILRLGGNGQGIGLLAGVVLVGAEDGGHDVRVLAVGGLVDGAPGCLHGAEEAQGGLGRDGYHVALGKVGRQAQGASRQGILQAVGARHVAFGQGDVAVLLGMDAERVGVV